MSVIRTNLKYACASMAVLCFAVLAGSSGAQDQNPKLTRSLDEKEILERFTRKRTEAKLESLDKMLISAMENNPELLVAKSKVREAEAELNRTRLQLARQIVTLRFSVEHQRERVNILQVEVKRGQIKLESLREALIELFRLESELQYALGKTPSGEEGRLDWR